jgi:phage terminase large subunit-like protein
VWAVLVGRCETIPGYQVITTAQSGKRARARLMKVADILERQPHIKVGRGVGNEHITWTETGSRIEMFPPVPGAFRGEGKDAVLIDEAQEIEDEDGADELLQAIMPLFDTQPEAQLIVAGTAGEHRAGLLWQALQHGRAGRWGIVDYAAPDGADAADEKVWLATHPGIGTLTTLGIMRQRWVDLKGDADPTHYGREYLGMWPTSEQIRLIPEQAWEACYAGDGRQPRPQPGQAVIGYDVAPNDSAASIVCAWRDEHGIGRLKVLDHGPGHTWMPERLRKMSAQLRAPIAYDAIGPNVAVAEALVRKAPRPKLVATNVRQMQAGCAQLLAEIKDRTIRHEGEAPLDEAVAAAAKRAIGEGGWVWGRRASVGDISALIAATAALRAVDELPSGDRPMIRTPRR